MSNLEQLKDLVSTSVETGILLAQVNASPLSDRIRKKGAEALLERHGLSKVLLQRWVGDGLIVETKGERNSPKTYSMIELMKTIGAVKMHHCIK